MFFGAVKDWNKMISKVTFLYHLNKLYYFSVEKCRLYFIFTKASFAILVNMKLKKNHTEVYIKTLKLQYSVKKNFPLHFRK